MSNAVTRIHLALCFTLFAAGPAFSQTPSDEVKPEATAPAPVANVYVQTNRGVNVYNAIASGELTLLKGSPFADTGQMEGNNGGYLISVGTDYLHSYKIESNGAVGPQASEINTQSYAGSDCGTTFDASILDHTGQYFSVQLYGSASNSCSALQTYKVASNGEFTFLGDTVSTDGVHGSAYQQAVSTYSSNDEYAYGSMSTQGANIFDAFRRASAGDLVVNTSFSQSGPTPDPSLSSGTYEPWAVAADPANHLAAVVYTPFADSTTMQLASYTINNSTGAVQSTNTYANMPVVEGYPITINMSWAGNLLAVGSGNGLQIFHFNGAAPPTAYSGVLLPKVEIDQLAWDKSNHLYALSYSAGELYVYTVTPASISEVSGSPYKVEKPYGLIGLIVVPK